MSNGRQLLVVAIVLAAFGVLAVFGGPALTPGEPAEPAVDTGGENGPETAPDGGEGGQNSEATGDASATPDVVDACAAEPPSDFADPDGGNAVVGWVDGYWYNEPLDIDAEGGISETDLRNLSARTAARFEAIRCLTAEDGVPPVEIQTREEFQDEQEQLFANVTREQRLFENAKLATMLLAGDATDAIDEQEANRGTTVGGSYNFREDEITVVSDDPHNLQIDEEVLAHEIGHAIQDQHFNLSQYERPTVDTDKGILGLIEGDVSLIERQYLEACETGDWEQACVTQDTNTTGGGLDVANWGLYFQSYQPYSDGPAFVEHVYETNGGWEAVNDLYEDPPTSAIQLVKPESYRDLQPTDVDVPDESSDEWERIDRAATPDYDTIGIAGISAMFMAPVYETQGRVSIYEPDEILNGQDALSPLEYYHPETAGWRGDRLYAYRGAENQTGSVWTLEWDDSADREPFVESYREALEYRGGEPVDGSESTYRFDDVSEYEMAVTIETTGDRVTIVTAPSVDQLDEIHDVEPASAG